MDEAQRIARLEERLAWLERHVVELEERLAWLERHVVEQDKVMLEMSEDIVRLHRELRAMRDRLPTGGQGEPEDTANERPPHY